MLINDSPRWRVAGRRRQVERARLHHLFFFFFFSGCRGDGACAGRLRGGRVRMQVMFPVTWERHASLKVSSEITTSYTDSLHMYTDMLILSDKNFPSNQPAPDDDTHCGLVHVCASCLIKGGVWVGWFKSPSESRTDGAFSCFHRDIIKAVKRVFSPLFFCIFQMVGLLLRFPTKTEDVSQLQISAAAIFRSSAELILLSEKLSRIPA